MNTPVTSDLTRTSSSRAWIARPIRTDAVTGDTVVIGSSLDNNQFTTYNHSTVINIKLVQCCKAVADGSRSEGLEVVGQPLAAAVEEFVAALCERLNRLQQAPEQGSSRRGSRTVTTHDPDLVSTTNGALDGAGLNRVEAARNTMAAIVSPRSSLIDQAPKPSRLDRLQDYRRQLHELAEALDALRTFWRAGSMRERIETFKAYVTDIARLSDLDLPDDDEMPKTLRTVKHFVSWTFPPTFTLETKAFHVVKKAMEDGKIGSALDLLGIYLDIRRPFANPRALHALNDEHPKERRIALLFLSVTNTGLKGFIKEWLQKRGIEPNRRYRDPWILRPLCVLNQVRRTLCGVQVMFHVAETLRECQNIKIAQDFKVFKVLCFKLTESETLETACDKWDEMQRCIPSGSKAPDVLLGLNSQEGEVRPKMHQRSSYAEISDPGVTRLRGREKAKDYKAAEGQGTTGGSQSNTAGAKLYIECAGENINARDVLFPTLIGCATAYTHFENQ